MKFIKTKNNQNNNFKILSKYKMTKMEIIQIKFNNKIFNLILKIKKL
jgi:hypothetical protein